MGKLPESDNGVTPLSQQIFPADRWFSQITQAADRYDKIKESGAPEFNVFFRKTGATDEVMTLIID